MRTRSFYYNRMRRMPSPPFDRDAAERLLERTAALRHRGRSGAAIKLLSDPIRLAADDVEVLVPLLNERGLAEEQLGDYHAARNTLAEVRRLFEAGLMEGDVGLASVIDNQGFVEREGGNLFEAKRFHEEAVHLLRGLDAPSDLAHALTNLAVVQKDLGYLHEAQATADEALDLVPFSDQRLAGFVRTIRGLIFQLLREWDAARREFVMAIVADRAAGDEENVAIALHNLATVQHERGKIPTALNLLRRSMSINQRLGLHSGMANDLRRLALFAGAAGRLQETRKLLLRARRAARRANDLEASALCELDLGRVALFVKDTKEAIHRCTLALELAEQFGSPLLLHEIRLARGTAWRRRRKYDRAVADLEAAVAAIQLLREGTVTEDLGLRFFTEMGDAYVQLVEVAMEQRDLVAAWSWAERTRGQELHRRLRRSADLQPRGVAEAIQDRERVLLRDLEEAISRLDSAAREDAAARGKRAWDDLRRLWDDIVDVDPEYVALRTGATVTFSELYRDLRDWSQSQSPISAN